MLEAANAALRVRGTDPGVEDMVDRLDQLELPRLDYRARGPAGPWESRRRRARRGLRLLLMLLSEDGHERERAVREIPLSRGAAGLIVVRCGDWVWQVRAAALARVEADFAPERLVELLPLVERVAGEWARGGELDALVERRLDDGTLAAALDHADARVRLGAWRRLLARGVTGPDLLARGFADPDTRVRSLVARALPELPPERRREAATALLSDPFGKLAARALDVLVELDGAEPIPAALVAPAATLRHRARDWAAVHGVDARAVYLARLRRDPADAVALVALAETADARDLDTIRRAAGDPRGYVRAVALRALAALDQGAGRAAAVEALLNDTSGRVTRAAAQVLRATPPFEADAAARRGGARPAARPAAAAARDRRAAALALAAPRGGSGGAPGGGRPVSCAPRSTGSSPRGCGARPRSAAGPDPATRASIELALPTVREDQRRAIEFVLRTTSR